MALARTARMHWAGTYDQALDYAAGAVVRQGGGLYCARLLRPHGAVAPVDDAASWDTLAPAPAQAGTPVLYGPYVVDYTDIPHDGNKKTLWTPAVGDVLLRLFADWPNCTSFDHGHLFVGQNVDATVSPLIGILARSVVVGGGGVMNGGLDTVYNPLNGDTTDSAGNGTIDTAHVFHTTDPVQIQLAQTGGTDPGAGHVELYALIARAVAP